eukprot:2647109-Rhodomonas_salina.1
MSRFGLTGHRRKAVTDMFEIWVQKDPMAQGYLRDEGREALFRGEQEYITRLISIWAQQGCGGAVAGGGGVAAGCLGWLVAGWGRVGTAVGWWGRVAGCAWSR